MTEFNHLDHNIIKFFNFQLFVSGISGHVQLLMRMDSGTYQVCAREILDQLLQLLIMYCISNCVSTLDASCYGLVTAIECCYRYTISAAGSGQVTFSYTVLVLEDAPGNNFLINRTYTIQNRGSVGSPWPHCDRSGDQVTCCDVLWFVIGKHIIQ